MRYITNQSLFLILLLFSLTSFAQGERILIHGNIISDGAELQNIHILNKHSKKGAITNIEGEFKIEVQEKDTLIITGIQFYYLEVLITNKSINNRRISINLVPKMNELEEVEVSHNLTGNISVDANDIKISKNVKEDVLNFAELDLRLLEVKWDDDSRSRTSSDSQLMPNLNANLLAIAGIILKPIVNGVSKIGETKRNIKKYDKRYTLRVMQAQENLRTDFGDAFFTETLHIPSHHIEALISHCLQKGMGNLYADDKKIEIIDMFIVESAIYVKSLDKNKK